MTKNQELLRKLQAEAVQLLTCEGLRHLLRRSVEEHAAYDRLLDAFEGDEEICAFLGAPNGYMGGRSLSDSVYHGRFSEIESALEALDSGIHV